MSKPRICVLGSIHMDMVIYVDTIPKLGETVIGHNFETHYGGKGANQAVAASRLGVYTYMVSRVGNDNIGVQLIKNLENNKVNVDFVKRDSTTHSGVALIMVDKNGNNIIAVASGADMRICKEDVKEAFEKIPKLDILLLQLEIPLKTVEYAVKKAKWKDVKVILNPAPARILSDNIYRYVDILTPNKVELELLSGIKTSTMEDIEKACRKIIEKGVKTVIVTLGEHGAVIITENQKIHVPTVKVVPKDTTGAGDAFNGALAVALSEGRDLVESVKFANYAAALKVTKKGAQTGLPTRVELEEFIERNAY